MVLFRWSLELYRCDVSLLGVTKQNTFLGSWVIFVRWVSGLRGGGSLDGNHCLPSKFE